MNWYWLMYAFVVLEKFQGLLIEMYMKDNENKKE